MTAMADFQKLFTLLITCADLRVSTVSSGVCNELQYLKLYQPGIVLCSIEEGYIGIQWYNSTQEGTEAIITFVSSEKGGQGYESGDYDIFPNGSLVIANVTLLHERVFSVSVAASKDGTIAVYAIQVKTFVSPTHLQPRIYQCQNQTPLCLLEYNTLSSSLCCIVQGARPMVSLTWSQRKEDIDTLLRSELNITSENETFTTRTTLQIASNASLLSLYVCKADNNQWLLAERETLVVLENKNLELEYESDQYYTERFKTSILPCHGFDTKTDVLVWKRSLGYDFHMDVILIAVFNGTSRPYVRSMNGDFSLEQDGSLMLQKPDWIAEGRYVCLLDSHTNEDIKFINVVLFVDPRPLRLVVDGCNPQQYCVLEVQRTGNVTCSVYGIRPEVNLHWRSLNEDSVFSFFGEQRNVTQQEGTLDISLTTSFKISSTFSGRLTLECRTSGKNSDIFPLSVIVDLVLETNGGTPSVQSIFPWIVVIIAASIVISIIVILLYKASRKSRYNTIRELENEENIPMTEGLQDADEFTGALKVHYMNLYKAVRPVPYIDDKMYCVNSIFVDGGIEVLEVDDIDLGRYWKPLKSYMRMINERNYKFGKQIIEGEPGYGKSTLALQLAYDWCNATNGSPLQNIAILIVLRLRQLRGVKSIYEAITSLLLPQDFRLKGGDVKSIITNASSVMFILDGFDEYPDKDNQGTDISFILRGKMLQDAQIILTTRPHYIPRDMTVCSQRIRLKGFSEDDRDEYIRKSVAGNDREAAERVKNNLGQSLVIYDLCEVPLFFVMFAHMTHEREDFGKFQSVTSLFRYIISCFQIHMENKMKETKDYFQLEKDHNEFNKFAFEVLNSDDTVWDRNNLQKSLGKRLYELYTRIGILVEEAITENKVDVRFFYNIFCEWYGANYIVDVLSHEEDVEVDISTESSQGKLYQLLLNLHPANVEYFYRFACGLDGNVCNRIVGYLQYEYEGEQYAINCIMEQKYESKNMNNLIKSLVSIPVKINNDHSKLTQRSTIDILDIANREEIIVSCLLLNQCCHIFCRDVITLHSGLKVPKLLMVERVEIVKKMNGFKKMELSEEEIVNIFSFGTHSRILRSLSFDGCFLPLPFPVNIISKEIISRKIQVLWYPYGYRLNVNSGVWEINDLDAFKRACSETVSIKHDDSELVQRCAQQLLNYASTQGIQISRLLLNLSLESIQDGYILIKSNLQLDCPSTVEVLVVHPECRPTPSMTIEEFGAMMSFAKALKHLREISFGYCILPLTISSDRIPPEFLSMDVKVSWKTFNLDSERHNLNLRTGLWISQSTGKRMTDKCYKHEVNQFRDKNSNPD